VHTYRSIAVVAILCSAAPAAAQSDVHLWHFQDLPYYEPLKADPRAARVQLVVPAWGKEFPQSVKPGTRRTWQITLGRELPIAGVRSENMGNRVGRHQWGLGAWIPVSFHMIEDFKDESAPIVDTDYRFGFMTKGQVGLTDDMWLGVRFTPWAHESTHLGDEYTIAASRNPAFERINVSYEYREYGVSLEKAFGADAFILIVRHGGISLVGKDGYYSDHLLGSTTPTLSISQKNFEPSFGFEARGGDVLGRQLFVSIDERDKLQYQYHRAANADEHRFWSTSLAIGLAVPENTVGLPLKSYSLNVYKGINPYGQLRSQRDFWSVGVGFVFGS
jgi:hypothetical protein